MEIETVPITENIYVLYGRGGNIGVLVGEDGVFLVDDQFTPLTAKIKGAIAKFIDEPIKFVINTHWHFDHTDGNKNLGKEGVVILLGHGEITDCTGLVEYRNMLRVVHATTLTAIASGKTLEEFIASDPTAAFDEKWGETFLEPAAFQTIVYRDLSR
ncbi:hypothetical protein Lepto7376_2744 [[Leptolyngbya] sp. PCC 7376]|uniref:MBL fold metallo-hydrolase n=1 Tax=[Leptolyngbya] sp. PCC 7376 TaxID=111781 RepID=UPI00029F1C44|nr:MBL fold metallo-hydrolase [[Leptolyngbya] sp. PCC 7376]AFY39005.1 hypothetical protein Lepto7376_2744 [[Leptolyngbya] sp. PCC 7376]